MSRTIEFLYFVHSQDFEVKIKFKNRIKIHVCCFLLGTNSAKNMLAHPTYESYHYSQNEMKKKECVI